MIIGITTTYVEEEQKDEIVPVERVTVEYVRRVAAAGAVPVLLPPVEGGADANRRAARELVERLDGLVLAGGGDLNPATYGDEARLAETVNVFDGRDALELELARLAHERDLPTLGICRGMQVMNVALGGSLYRDLYNCGVTEKQHRQNPPYYGISHKVTIAKGSLLESVVSASGDFEVNSMHHQGVDHVAPALLVAARSEDRVVEAVEDPAKPFFLGVQWHPEYLDRHHGLFNALAAAAHHRDAQSS